MSQSTLLDQIHTLIGPVLEEMGLELVDLEYKHEGRDWFLRIFIDKEGGVNLDDCADASREVGTLLEVEDPIRTAYRLEVSSPGLERPLKRPRDYERFNGKLVKVKTFEKCDPDGRGYERKTFVGTLLGLDQGQVRIEQVDKKGGVAAFPLESIAQANLEMDF
ncbi:MAG: ribosome maturation factor [Desulfuromonas sp.]|uniref:ribosome maturation factor RimP n=1 Tax=Desulfuromonas sp. TaxID=892 RepID=UPI000CC326B0|nr:ribosome maturation factor RimP [Desulfuromonas sp.]PLX84743.1 MAG: ribosome maturation factor [Desulfuromonas sp.]